MDTEPQPQEFIEDIKKEVHSLRKDMFIDDNVSVELYKKIFEIEMKLKYGF